MHLATLGCVFKPRGYVGIWGPERAGLGHGRAWEILGLVEVHLPGKHEKKSLKTRA